MIVRTGRSLVILATVLGSAVFGQGIPDDRDDHGTQATEASVAKAQLMLAAESAFVLESRHHELMTSFRPNGVDFLPLDRLPAPEREDWTFGLSFMGMRRGARILPAGHASLQGGNGGFAYVYDSVVESYVECEAGLEQVFTLQAAPLSEALDVSGAPLELLLESRGDLCLHIAADRRNASLVDASGTTILTYTGLKAWDADGKQLDTYLCDEGNQFSIIVDDARAQYPIVIDPLIGCLRARLIPADLTSESWFGFKMALDGDTLVVSSVNTGVPVPNGAVYVYRRAGATWTREAKLLSSSSDPDAFGSSVAIHGDTVAVGAPGANDFGSNSGAVFVFTRAGNQWSQQARLLASDGAAEDGFGYSVAIQQDRLVIGAWQDDDSGLDSGSAYVFQRSGATWLQTSKLVAANAQPRAEFGWSVDLDGPAIVVGAPFHNQNAGAAYVFRNSAGTWSQEGVVTAPFFLGAFAWSVAISNDTIVCGQPGSPPVSVFGKAYIFRRNVAGSWVPEATLDPVDGTMGNGFGEDVDILNNRAFIGSPGTPYYGAAYVFEKSGPAWGQVAKLVPVKGPWFGALGYSVALSTSLLAAADIGDSQVGWNSGAAYIFDLVEAHTSYCTSKINSLGCAPTIAAQGAASANDLHGLVISGSQVINNTPGLLMYSIAGRNNVIFQGGVLCLNPPVRRTPVQSSGGTPAPTNDCSGSFSIDMNFFARGGLGGNPIPALGVIGTVVQCQWWGRDQGFVPPINSMLSDAVEYTIGQ